MAGQDHAKLFSVVSGVCPVLCLQVLQLGPVEAVVVLICGCCPGGSLSNILALSLKGDMNLRYIYSSTFIYSDTILIYSHYKMCKISLRGIILFPSGSRDNAGTHTFSLIVK